MKKIKDRRRKKDRKKKAEGRLRKKVHLRTSSTTSSFSVDLEEAVEEEPPIVSLSLVDEDVAGGASSRDTTDLVVATESHEVPAVELVETTASRVEDVESSLPSRGRTFSSEGSRAPGRESPIESALKREFPGISEASETEDVSHEFEEMDLPTTCPKCRRKLDRIHYEHEDAFGKIIKRTLSVSPCNCGGYWRSGIIRIA